MHTVVLLVAFVSSVLVGGSLAQAAEGPGCAGLRGLPFSECEHQAREAPMFPPYPDGRRVGSCPVPAPGSPPQQFSRYADCLQQLKAEQRRLAVEKILGDLRGAETAYRARLESQRVRDVMELADAARRQATRAAGAERLTCTTTRIHGVPITTCE